jgi:hypothetical protein
MVASQVLGRKQNPGDRDTNCRTLGWFFMTYTGKSILPQRQSSQSSKAGTATSHRKCMAILTFRRLDFFIRDKSTTAEAFRVRYQEKHLDVHGACVKSARQFLNQWKGTRQRFTRLCVVPKAS